jgi:hypothetical protein
MVCYSSMSPQPSSASMLCSASASFCFYALLFFLLRPTSYVQFFFCILCSVRTLHSFWLHLFFAPFLLLTTTLYAHASIAEKNIICMSLSRQVLYQIILETLHHNSYVMHINSIYPLICFAYHIFAQFSRRSSSQLCHFTGSYSLSIHHQCMLS